MAHYFPVENKNIVSPANSSGWVKDKDIYDSRGVKSLAGRNTTGWTVPYGLRHHPDCGAEGLVEVKSACREKLHQLWTARISPSSLIFWSGEEVASAETE